MTDERTQDRDNAYAKTLNENRELRNERDRLVDALQKFVQQVAYFRDGDGSMAELVEAEREARAALAGDDTSPRHPIARNLWDKP